MSPIPAWFANPDARGWRTEPLGGDAIAFHRSLPGYAETPLREVPAVADELGVGHVFVKEESGRLGLPAFKILGASYAISRALSARLGEDRRALPLDELRERVAAAGIRPCLIAATDGNHGRAVAHIARLLGLPARVLFPPSVSDAAKRAIADEGAEAIETPGEYDEVVAAGAARAAADDDALLVQDTAWPGYEDVPQWIVDGYSTLAVEADAQLAALGVRRLDLVVVPVGVGSLAQAIVRHYRSETGARVPAVLLVEADRAPGLIASLAAGRPLSVPTADTVMTGLNCGTPSTLAWPVLAPGADAVVTVSDTAAATAVRDLEAVGVDAGPCGAATLAGVRTAATSTDRRDALRLGTDAVVLLLSTEGRAANPLPPQKRDRAPEAGTR